MRCAVRIAAAFAVGALVLGHGSSHADEVVRTAPSDPLEEVDACLERNVPKTTAVQNIRFTQWDRHGDSMTCSGVVYQARFPHEDFPKGRRKLKLLFEKPADVRGTEFVFHQRGQCADAWVYRPADRKPRRLPCSEGGGTLPCSDFTAEDFARLYKMNDSPHRKRRPDAALNDLRCYVVETEPRKAAAQVSAQDGKRSRRKSSRNSRVASLSVYDLIVSHVDQSSCLVLQEEGFEKAQLLKRLTTDPESIHVKGGLHWAGEMKMEDVSAHTHTDLEAGEPKLGCDLDARIFDEKAMGQRGKVRCD